MKKPALLIVVLALCAAASAQVEVVVDHNAGSAATAAFTFSRVPKPARDDAASRAKVDVIVGEADGNSAGTAALIDGALPSGSDSPQANFFFNAGTDGGRVRFDLGKAMEIAQVNSYSWHTGSRAPQVYNLFIGDDSAAGFNPSPDEKTDPATCGWRLVATVDTRPPGNDVGGQYGVSVRDANGTLGRARYVLIDTVPTESEDAFGNTFFSEFDIIAKP